LTDLKGKAIFEDIEGGDYVIEALEHENYKLDEKNRKIVC